MSSDAEQAGHKSLNLYKDSQIRHYRNAKELVEEDLEEENITEGEVVEHLSKAYAGLL